MRKFDKGGSGLQAILDYAPAAIYVKDTEGRFLLVNRRFEQLFDLDRAAVIGKTDYDLFPTDAADGFMEHDRKVFESGEPLEVEEEVPQKEGLHTYSSLKFPLRDDTGQIYAICGISNDITDRKRAEAEQEAVRAALHESEARFRALVEGVKDYALFLTDENGFITSWNPGVCRILGFDEEEIVGQHVRIIYTLEDREAGVPEQELQMAQTQGYAPDERWHVRKDGSRFWASGVVHPVCDPSGRLTGFTKVLTDATERKQAEERLEEAYRQERRIAETLQRSLLMSPPPDTFPGLTIKTLYEPAWSDALIGGDFFDVFAVAEDRVACVIGDATGKGLPAATYTAEVKFALRAFLREFASPAIALERLNNFVVDAERLDRAHLGASYVAVAIVLVDTRTGEVIAASAGMEAPFILRDGPEGELVELAAGGLMLGVEPRTEYDAQTNQLQPGDLLVMTTDGIIEARRGREFFGQTGLVNALRETLPVLPTLAAVGEAVMQRAKTFAGRRLQDDVCLLLARRRAVTPEPA